MSKSLVLMFVLAFALALAPLLTASVTGTPAQETTDETTASPEAVAEPEQGETVAKPPAPDVAARSWALVDLRSGEYLAGESASKKLPMASTTKIMVALVALEEADLDEKVVVSEKAASFARPIYSNVGLLAGDELSVRDLLKATLISSGDDAVYALAEHLGGGDAQRFIEEMNREAKEMGLKETHFENPSGLDARGHHSSARDLATMTRSAMKYPLFREMVGTSYAAIYTQDREIPLTNTNDLLATYPPTTGVKTGTTPAAGSSLVASAAAGNEAYVAVFLDSQEDRFAAAVRTLEHGFTTYDREALVKGGDRYAKADVPYRRGEKVPLVAKEDIEGLVYDGSDVEREPKVMRELPDSARRGTKLGEIEVRVDGERVGEAALVARKGYEEASIWQRLWYTVEGIFE
ncbi:MAG TPA: D-alanyl-D-alanine carboxypeptidase family protein [Rubrobacteraceae bacterium]|nr:D-alanyl-D-alanine carboxypeptidase family protein [Rubrobacteraceae bacterium]